MKVRPIFAGLSAALVLGAAHAAPQSPTVNGARAKHATGERSEAADALIDLSRAAPPEFAADVLIRIAGSTLLSDRKQRRAVLEEAFRLASSAQNPIKLEALPGTDIDSRSGYLSMAYEAGLDSLSLKCRAVHELIPVDRSAARRLFSEAPVPRPPALTCADKLVYDLNPYYSVLIDVARLPAEANEIHAEKPFDLVMKVIGGTVSPVQVAPVTRAVREIASSAGDLEAFVAALGSALAGVAADYRSFSTTGAQFAREVGLLSDACRSKGVSNVAFLAAVHGYFVRQLHGARCGSSPADRELAARLVRAYNEGIRSKSVPLGAALPDIAEPEAEPDKIEASGPPDLLWTDSDGHRLRTQVRALRASRDQLVDDEWRGRYFEIVSKVANWGKGDDVPTLDYLHEKCALFRALLETAPDDAAREPVLGADLTFLEQWNVVTSRIEWFLHAREILTMLGPAGGSKHSAWIETELNSVQNPILILYVRLHTLIPPG
ncbi:MAG: hypothetical protein ACLP59_18205 [Bryobacteraceae bacterium]